jgi:hypothetical protein
MKLSEKDYELLFKKLEYKFKKSDHELVNKIKDQKNLSEEDIKLLLKKLEYTFRKSGNEIIERLSKMCGMEDYSPIQYSNLKAKKQRDLKPKKEGLNHIETFEKYFKS